MSNQQFYVADEYAGGHLVGTPTGYETLEEAITAIDRRRTDYLLFSIDRRPHNFVILRTQVKFPYILPVDRLQGIK